MKKGLGTVCDSYSRTHDTLIYLHPNKNMYIQNGNQNITTA